MLDTLSKKVTDLIEAENHHNSGDASKILSKNFISITRASGIEEDRDTLLQAIETSKLDGRTVEKLSTTGEESDRIRVVRSIVKVPKSYRNTHVFVKEENEEWRCISWQVTELK